jgi:hypothetical protein
LPTGPGPGRGWLGCPALPGPPAARWLDFWSKLDQCGEIGWPQLIRLPVPIIPTRAKALYNPSQAARMLRQAASMPAANPWDDAEQLVTFEPDEGENYQITPAPVDDFGGSLGETAEEDEAGESAENRQIVFLDSRALPRQQDRPAATGARLRSGGGQASLAVGCR